MKTPPRLIFLVFALGSFLSFATPAGASPLGRDLPARPTGRYGEPSAIRAERNVIRIFDGDTLLVSPGEKIRLIGIDTMEVHDGEKLTRQARIYHLKEKEIKKQGMSAKQIVEKLLQGKRVRLEPGPEAKDAYGRTLAYVYFTMREDKLAKIVGQKFTEPRPPQEKEFMLDRVMVQYGWAEALTHYPFDYLNEFAELQHRAKENHWGIWKRLLKEPPSKN
jgi:endonuclease YncB( thermonuclease family)